MQKGFSKRSEFQLHRRGHNLPWKLKKRKNEDDEQVKKKVYICPEKTCVHHDPSKALGDLTGIKKHFSRKHGEKKWMCEKCAKKYAVQSDWKAHTKICGTREYKCHCGTLFSRKDSFITHRAFCDTLAGESERFSTVRLPPNLSFRNAPVPSMNQQFRSELDGIHPVISHINLDEQKRRVPLWLDNANNTPFGDFSNMSEFVQMSQNHWSDKHLLKEEDNHTTMSSSLYDNNYNNQEININGGLSSEMSATTLLQKAAQMGSTKSSNSYFNGFNGVISSSSSSPLSNLGNFNSRNFEIQHLNNHENHLGLWFGDINHSSSSRENEGQDGNLTRDFLAMPFTKMA